MPDFRRKSFIERVRVVGRGGIMRAIRGIVYVKAQNFAMQIARVLRQPKRVALIAAISEACIEIAIRAEGDVPPVVIDERLFDRQDDEAAFGDQRDWDRLR